MKAYLLLIPVLMLSGCASSPPGPSGNTSGGSMEAKSPAVKPGGYYKDDGPEENPPANLDSIPDAQPRHEPLHPYANRTYVALGQSYEPHTELQPFVQEGMASWYGRKFNGKRTSSGEPYDMYAMTAAHPTLPIPSYARVTALTSGKSVVVRINDRGPFHSRRIIDLSYTAAYKLGIVQSGQGRVRVESINPDSDRGVDAKPAGGIYIQLGAFGSVENARQLLDRVHADAGVDSNQGRIVYAQGLHRVSLGPFTSERDADALANHVRVVLGIDPVKQYR